jgi:hypothetical protein
VVTTPRHIRRLAITLAVLVGAAGGNVVMMGYVDDRPRFAVVEVRDALTGVPLQGATVRFDNDLLWSRTNSSGKARYYMKVRPRSSASAGMRGYRTSYGHTWRTTKDTIYTTCLLPRTKARTVIGQVTNGMTGAPMAGALIRIGSATAESHGGGKFVLRASLGSRSDLRVGGCDLPRVRMTVLPGPGDTAYVDVTLYESTVSGIVAGHVDDGVRPVDGASIVLHDTDLGAATGPGGEYIITGVTPGDYLAEASYIGTYGRTLWVSVRPGETTRVNWKLYANPNSPW